MSSLYLKAEGFQQITVFLGTECCYEYLYVG
jgi:hypothetical protein